VPGGARITPSTGGKKQKCRNAKSGTGCESGVASKERKGGKPKKEKGRRGTEGISFSRSIFEMTLGGKAGGGREEDGGRAPKTPLRSAPLSAFR